MSDIQWQKASFSGSNGESSCVELARPAEVVLLRESDEPGVIATASPARVRALIRAIKGNGFDWQKSSYSSTHGETACIELARPAGAVLLRESDDPGVITAATAARTRALLQAVKRGAFDSVV
jgi:hypothetical protein